MVRRESGALSGPRMRSRRIPGRFRGTSRGSPARVAQLAEQLSCKQQVRSSILLSGSEFQGFPALGMLRIRRLLIPC